MRTWLHALALSVPLALAVVACADPGSDRAADAETPADGVGEGDATDGPAPAGVDVPGLTSACGPIRLGWPIADVSQFESFTGNVSELVGEDARFEFESTFGDSEPIRWFVAEQSDHELVLFGHGIDPEGGPAYMYARFEQENGDWRARGWGGCDIVVAAPGFGVATFQLDPENPPDADSTTIHVLATERECASGKPPTGRQVVPVVVESETSLDVTILVESPRGDQSCPSNPAFPFTVELGAPLGDRVIRDSALLPPEERPWPIPEAAARLSIEVSGDVPAPGTANVFAWSGDRTSGEGGGALLLRADEWSVDPRWIQSFEGFQPADIRGFVTACDGCEEECEGAACDALPRLGPECVAPYLPISGQETTMTIRYAGGACTIEVDVQPID